MAVPEFPSADDRTIGLTVVKLTVIMLEWEVLTEVIKNNFITI